MGRSVKAVHDNSGSGIIRTYTGRMVKPLSLTLDDIDIREKDVGIPESVTAGLR